MMKKITKIAFLLIAFAVNITVFSQVTQDDVASWGLKVLSSELNKKGEYGTADAVLGLSRLFEISSERRYQRDLARIMTNLNLPNGVYAINGGNIATVPNGYIKQEGEWFSLSEFDDGDITMIVNGELYDVPNNWLMFYKGNNWYRLETDKLTENQAFFFENGEIKTLNDGWYTENGEWKNVKKLENQIINNYNFHSSEPYGLYSYSIWTDSDNDGIKDKTELSGLNKETYNIAKEHLIMALNIPVVSDNVVFTSWRDGRLIGSTVIDMKKKGNSYANQTGPTGDPSVLMDYMDRILFDVKKYGAGNYKIIATNTNKEFEIFEKTIKIIYQP